MGWAIIEGNLGNAVYSASSEDGEAMILYATDYVDDIPVGTKVGTIDIERGKSSFDRQIKPGKCSWKGTRHNETTDGQMTGDINNISSPAAAFLAIALNDAAIKWRPKFVRGTVVGINVPANTIRVASSRVAYPDQYFAEWLPVEYMSKNAEVFDLSDDVVVKMVNGQPQKVIGFYAGAKPDTPNSEDITCGHLCQGEEDCECCTDPNSDACAAFCEANPTHKTCVAILDPAGVANPDDICYPCSRLRLLICDAKDETGVVGCECHDNPGLDYCSQCCEGSTSEYCVDYCVENPDDDLCKREPITPCQVPDGYFRPAGLTVNEAVYSAAANDLCARPPLVRAYFRSSYNNFGLDAWIASAVYAAIGITIRSHNFSYYSYNPDNASERHAWDSAYTDQPSDDDYYYSAALEWINDPVVGRYIKKFRIIYSVDLFAGAESFDTYPETDNPFCAPQDAIVYGRLYDIIVSSDFFDSPITTGGGAVVSVAMWNSTYIEFIVSPSPEVKKYFSAAEYLADLMPFLHSITYFLRGNWVTIRSCIGAVDMSRFLSPISVPIWVTNEGVPDAEFYEAGQTIHQDKCSSRTWRGVAYDGKMHGFTSSFVDGIGCCSDGTIGDITGPCS